MPSPADRCDPTAVEGALSRCPVVLTATSCVGFSFATYTQKAAVAPPLHGVYAQVHRRPRPRSSPSVPSSPRPSSSVSPVLISPASSTPVRSTAPPPAFAMPTQPPTPVGSHAMRGGRGRRRQVGSNPDRRRRGGGSGVHRLVQLWGESRHRKWGNGTLARSRRRAPRSPPGRSYVKNTSERRRCLGSPPQGSEGETAGSTGACRVLNTTRTRWRLRHRNASLLVLPSARFLAR